MFVGLVSCTGDPTAGNLTVQSPTTGLSDLPPLTSTSPNTTLNTTFSRKKLTACAIGQLNNTVSPIKSVFSTMTGSSAAAQSGTPSTTSSVTSQAEAPTGGAATASASATSAGNSIELQMGGGYLTSLSIAAMSIFAGFFFMA